MSKKLRAGDLLVGTCKCDDKKKDLFVVVAPTKEEKVLDCSDNKVLLLHCITREIGWPARRSGMVNQFTKGTTLEELNEEGGLVEGGKNEYPLDHGYDDYTYEKIDLIPLDFLKKKITRDREE